MSKVTLNDASLFEQSLLNTINTNNTLIEDAIENTLSRDGTSPNTMDTSLDMNSHRILNLPEAVAGTEPIRKQELDDYLDAIVSSGSITIVNVDSTSEINATDYGVVADGVTDCSTELANAAAAAHSAKKILRLPPGVIVLHNVVLTQDGLRIVGCGGSIAGNGTTIKRQDNYAGYLLALAGKGQEIRDVSIDGNGPNQTSFILSGVKHTSTQPELFLEGNQNYPNVAERVGIFNYYADVAILCNNWTEIIGCQIYGPGFLSINPDDDDRGFLGIQDQNANSFCKIDRCEFYNITGPAATGIGSLTNCHIESCHHKTYASSGGCATIQGAIIGNTIVNGGEGASGLEVSAANAQITGNYIYNMPGFGIIFEGGVTDAPYFRHIATNNIIESCNIGINYGGDGSIAMGNIIKDCVTAGSMTGTSDYNIFTHNVCIENTNPFSNTSSGTHNIIALNPGDV